MHVKPRYVVWTLLGAAILGVLIWGQLRQNGLPHKAAVKKPVQSTSTTRSGTATAPQPTQSVTSSTPSIDAGTPTGSPSPTLARLPSGITTQLKPFLIAYFTQTSSDDDSSREARIRQVMTKASFAEATSPKSTAPLDFSSLPGADTVTPTLITGSISQYRSSDGQIQVTAWLNLKVTAAAGNSVQPVTCLSSWKLQKGQYVLTGVNAAVRAQ